ncbi:MAG TPA: SCO family protein [Gemmatimonadaceae bacterium]|nr:SCO family protein [Gemmatimonadaceae bacterium]
MTGRSLAITARGRRFVFFSAAASMVVLGMVGCRQGDEGPSSAAMRGLRGEVREIADPVPDFTLVDTAGRPFRFAREARGYLTLLYFGYTQCPDICPVHLANLSAVLSDLPWDLRQRIRVVFVTTDPDRDTPSALRRWLDSFDPTFIGLSGSVEQINAAQARLGIPPLVREERGHGDYIVGHAAQMIAFTPDGRARVDYPFGTRQADWAHDLPLLAGSAGAGS